MKTKEDNFCEAFYQWWHEQTSPQRMTWEKAAKLMADCRSSLETKLVPSKMTRETFDEMMETARKVVLFRAAWDIAKLMSVDELQREHKIPKK